MKKILTLSLCVLAAASVAAEETEAQHEMNAYIQDGITKFSTPDGKYSFRVGARADIDGGVYFDDHTDRGNGATLSAARIRLFSKLGDHFDFKFDVDFMAKGNMLKDVFVRWHSNKNGFLRLGNFAEPFSAENIQSTMDYPFIAKSATVQAFGTGRALGLSYRYYHPYVWVEGGAFSQKLSNEYHGGDMGYSLSARLLGRYTSEDFNIHAGGSVNFRVPNANGIKNGSDKYNRSLTLSSNLESNIDNTPFLQANLNNVKSTFKYGLELMANYRNVYVKGEYIHTHVNRERDWDYDFNNSLGTFMGSMFPTIESYKAMMGEDTPANFQGFSVEAGVIAIGGDYSYNRVDALMRRPGGKTLEFVARFNYTSLNDVIPGSIYSVGMMGDGFYTSPLHQSFGIKNGSVAGGAVHTYTLGVNYYITKSLIARVDYSYSRFNNQYSLAYKMDRNLHSLMARVAYEF